MDALDKYNHTLLEEFCRTFEVSTINPIKRIAVIDTGVDRMNPYFISKKICFAGASSDSAWHGTSIVGMVGMSLDENFSVEVFDAFDDYRVDACKVIELARTAILSGNQLILIAMNGLIDTRTLQGRDIHRRWESVERLAEQRGVKIVVSAGNNGINLNKIGQFELLPAMLDSVLTVGAGTAKSPERYSNRGGSINLYAPGGSQKAPLVTTRNRLFAGQYSDEMVLRMPNQYIRMFGTSLSAGIVAGLIAKYSNL
ncbi:S8/S53 family peptidase [uncultured Secundilactobacillus sp.]|uniref:S8/S53 family peptidase n=1 Tax=uncultured Secundilactobacillus sp. TaxID=2813935 RepID=UPI00258421E4|nr:S8/S53 family peptidase [uncultured Secundilactobacillus sp.]